MIKIIREQPVLRENYLIKYYGKNNWSSYVKKYIKVLIDTLLEDMTNKVPRSIMIHTSIQKKSTAAFVKIDHRSINDAVFHVYIRDSYDFNDIASNLAHELVHVKQILEGDLETNRTGIVWQGEEYDIDAYEKATYRGKGDSDDAYWNAPWEIEARRLQDYYYAKWKGSSERKALVKQLGTEFLKYGMDNILAKYTPEDLQSGVPVKTVNEALISNERSIEAEKKLKKQFKHDIQSGDFSAEEIQAYIEKRGRMLGLTLSGAKRLIDWLEQFVDYDGVFDDF